MGTDIQRALLRRGYFPRELPPVFTTEDFGTHSDAIIEEWQKRGVFKLDAKSLGNIAKGKPRRGAYTYKLESADPEAISKPKKGFERRTLHITHPVPQALLALELSKHWRTVQKWLSRQIYSEDEIRISDKYERSIKGINFSLHREKKLYLESTSNWIVKTDITRFYPSIYTHSIAWAAYGKERVKNSLNHYKGSLAERLDLLVRSCNRNQTVGIPIGPETSRILAEVISSRIDWNLHSKCPEIPGENIDRLQDDWVLGVETLEQAEKTISVISEIYRVYGLDINGSKTSIDRIVAERQAAWVSEIGAFLSHGSEGLRGARLKEFLNLCLRLQSNNRADPVINYALSVIESSSIGISDTANMESFLLKAAVVAPNSMDRICRIILDIQHRTKGISAKRIGERFLKLAETSLENGHTYEVIWLLYSLRGLGRPVDCRKLCASMETMQSSSIALIILDMKAKGNLIGKLPTDTWQRQITEESILTDWTWLLAYEGFRHGWLADKHGLMTSPLLKPMADRKVVFYDPMRNVRTSKSFVAARRAYRKRDRVEVKLLMEFLRGVDLQSY